MVCSKKVFPVFTDGSSMCRYIPPTSPALRSARWGLSILGLISPRLVLQTTFAHTPQFKLT